MTIQYYSMNDYFVVLDSAGLRLFFDTLDTISSNMLLQYRTTPKGWNQLGLRYKSWQYLTQNILNSLEF